MPHPLVVVAGVAIVLGAGYLVVNELTRRSGEEEWYQNYCAMVRAESQQRTVRQRKEEEDKQEAGDEKEEDPETDAHSKEARTAGLRRRPAPHAAPDADFPLIDLSQHSYPPSTPSRRPSPPPQPRPAPLDHHIIFAAPSTSPEPPTQPERPLSASSTPPEPPSPSEPSQDPADPFVDQPARPAVPQDPFSDRSDGSSDAELVSAPSASPRHQQSQEDELSEPDWTDLGSQSSHTLDDYSEL